MTTETTPPAPAETTATPAPAEGATDATPMPAASATDLIVEAWFQETFHNLSALSGDHFNRFRASADRLKALLRASEK